MKIHRQSSRISPNVPLRHLVKMVNRDSKDDAFGCCDTGSSIMSGMSGISGISGISGMLGMLGIIRNVRNIRNVGNFRECQEC